MAPRADPLRDRAALVTGAGAGIGRAIAHELASSGARVAVVDVRAEAAEAVAGEIGAAAVPVTADVTTSAGARAMVARAVEAFGRLDVAVNNAGVGHTYVRTAELDEDEWVRVIDLNLNGVFRSMRYELPALSRPGGTIVNMASEDSVRGAPNWSALSASKHGVVGLTRSAALEYVREGLRINAICPSRVRTSQRHETEEELADVLRRLPIPRLLEPEEVARCVRWLACDEAAYVNGATLVVDGGGGAGLYSLPL